jgi:hypothetical protein
VVETPGANLVPGMARLHGACTIRVKSIKQPKRGRTGTERAAPSDDAQAGTVKRAKIANI